MELNFKGILSIVINAINGKIRVSPEGTYRAFLSHYKSFKPDYEKTLDQLDQDLYDAEMDPYIIFPEKVIMMYGKMKPGKESVEKFAKKVFSEGDGCFHKKYLKQVGNRDINFLLDEAEQHLPVSVEKIRRYQNMSVPCIRMKGEISLNIPIGRRDFLVEKTKPKKVRIVNKKK